MTINAANQHKHTIQLFTTFNCYC